MSSNDEQEHSLDSLIEYDPYGSDSSDKENDENEQAQEETSTETARKKIRLSCTTPTQLDMLKSFMEGRRGFIKGSMRKTPENLELLREWEILVEQLNKYGPPVRSSSVWRKTWTDFKRKSVISPTTSISAAAEIQGSRRNVSGTGRSSTPFANKADVCKNVNLQVSSILDGPTTSKSSAAEISGAHRNILGTGCSSTAAGKENENGSVKKVSPMLDGNSETSAKSDETVDDNSRITSDVNEIKQYCKEILSILKGSQFADKS